MPIITVITDTAQANLWLGSKNDPPLSGVETTDPEVETGVAIGVAGLYVTPLMVAATSNTEPPPNS